MLMSHSWGASRANDRVVESWGPMNSNDLCEDMDCSTTAISIKANIQPNNHFVAVHKH